MAFFTDAVFDSGLLYVVASVDQIHICTQQPTTYTEATDTYSLGSAPVTLNPPQNGSPSGRAVVVPAATAIVINTNGDINFWAIVDSVNSVLVATGPVATSQTVAIGMAVDLDSVTITIVDPVAI